MTYTKLGALAGALLLLAAPTAAFGQAGKPPAMTHDAAGKEKCLVCHAVGVMEAVPDVPASHKDRGVETCLWCHAKDAAIQTKEAPAIPHTLQGRSTCMMCHKQGVMEKVPDAPADHQGRTDKHCQLCHHPKPA